MKLIRTKSWTFNSYKPSAVFHIETNQLICNANQMIGFYMKCSAGFKWVEAGFHGSCFLKLTAIWKTDS